MLFKLQKKLFKHLTGKEVDVQDSVVDETWYLWLKRWIFGFAIIGNAFGIIGTLVPVFKTDTTCDAIPSAMAFLITFVAIGILQGLLGAYKNITLLCDGGHATMQPFKRDVSAPARISNALGPAQMLVGLTWGSAIVFPNISKGYHKDDEQTECSDYYFKTLMACTFIIWGILGLIIFGGLFYFFFWLPRQRAKEEKEGEYKEGLAESLLTAGV